MNLLYEKLMKCYDSVRARISFVPRAAIVLGSGLGGYAHTMQVEATLDYHEIEGFPVSTVEGHAGRFVFGYANGVPVVCMEGRVHYYEGYSMQDVVLPIRLMRLLGAQTLLVTNAAGGIQDGMQPGDLMLITGQIASFVPSPLIGPNLDALGTRFPDMTQIYDAALREKALAAAASLGIPLRQGVYLQLSGPQYETPEEVRMCKLLGADAVGMSTCCETIAARHAGMRVIGISCICNLAAGIGTGQLSHEEVKAAADAVAPRFEALVDEIVKFL